MGEKTTDPKFVDIDDELSKGQPKRWEYENSSVGEGKHIVGSDVFEAIDARDRAIDTLREIIRLHKKTIDGQQEQLERYDREHGPQLPPEADE